MEHEVLCTSTYLHVHVPAAWRSTLFCTFAGSWLKSTADTLYIKYIHLLSCSCYGRYTYMYFIICYGILLYIHVLYQHAHLIYWKGWLRDSTTNVRHAVSHLFFVQWSCSWPQWVEPAVPPPVHSDKTAAEPHRETHWTSGNTRSKINHQT